MRIIGRIAIIVMASIVGVTGMELGSSLPVSLTFVTEAQAVVGRPLTPVSVAGVARRTSRRCAADVYDC